MLPVPNHAEVATPLPFKLYVWPLPRPAPLPGCARLNTSFCGGSGAPLPASPWILLMGGACYPGGAGNAENSFLFLFCGQSFI